MADWTKSMQQSFEYHVVNPNTWKDEKQLKTVKSCTITRDSSVETLGSATFEITETIGECYIRVYLVTIQNGIKEKHCLGTFIAQTPASTFNGKIREVSMDAYTPLLELKEKIPPLGYSVLKGENVMDKAYLIIRENARAPVIKASSDKTLHDNFVANTDDTWITFLRDFTAYANHTLALDEMGRILFAPEQDTASLQPVWDYKDDNSSILQPEFDLNHDLYGIPNVVEVVYSNGRDYYYSRVINDDPNSPTSTIRRGREIPYRSTNPSFSGEPTQKMIDEYARTLLRELSSIEYTVTYTHGYCPVRLDDCVRLNYTRAGVINTKAKVISQSIKCVPGCPVTEKAVYTAKLWG